LDLFLTGLTIFGVNIILSGDNGVLIAMVAASLPKEQKVRAIAIGAGLAVVFQVAATFFAIQLLHVRFLQLIGGVLILWISINLFRGEAGAETIRGEGGGNAAGAGGAGGGAFNAASADKDIAPTRYGPFSRTLSNRNRPFTTGTLVRKRPPAKRNTADPSEAVPSRTEAPPGASRTDSSLAEGARRRGGASGEGAERASSWRTVRRARITGVQAASATAATARRAGTRRTRWPCTARHTA